MTTDSAIVGHKAPPRPNSTGPLPTFLIIGAPRAATTSVAGHLAAHPDVFVPPLKEMAFFDSSERYERGLDWYRQQFRAAGTATAVGEASPYYMSVPNAIPRIASNLPDVRLVAILRNPVDRAYSHWWLNRCWGTERREFYEAVFREAAGLDAPARYLGNGRYATHLKHICEYLPRSQLLVVFFEAFRANPQGVLAEICEFIGVNPTGVPPHADEPLNQPHRARALRVWPGLPGSRRFLILEAARYRAGGLGRVVRAIDKCLVAPAPYPEMDPTVRSHLVQWYEGPNAALSAWLGTDLPW